MPLTWENRHSQVQARGALCFPWGSDGRESDYSAGDPGSSPGSGRCPREANGNPLQYSCLDGLQSMLKVRLRPPLNLDSPVVWVVKNLPAMQEIQKRQVWSLSQEDSPWRRKWQPTPVFFPGKSQGQRSLAGCSPWGHKESVATEHARTQWCRQTGSCCTSSLG